MTISKGNISSVKSKIVFDSDLLKKIKMASFRNIIGTVLVAGLALKSFSCYFFVKITFALRENLGV